MRKEHAIAIPFTLLVAFVVIRPARAAYIDPNTGGMLFQILAVLFGIFSGLLLFFSGQIKKAFYRFRRFLRGSGSRPTGEDDSQQDDETGRE